MSGHWIRMIERTHRSRAAGVQISPRTSVRQRIGPKLDVHGARHRALAAFLEPGRAVAVRAPQPAAFPPGGRTIERTLALAAVEAAEVAARQRRPDHAVLVDIAAADSERRRRNVEHLRKSGSRVKSQEPRRAAEDAYRVPDRTVDRRRHHR